MTLLPFIIIGIATGAVYGLAGVGLVLTYKTSGIFNFAYGAVAAVAVFIFYWLHTENGIPWPYAAIICLLVVAPLEGVLLELLARRLEPAGSTIKVVATVGVLLIVLGAGTLWYGSANTSFPPFLDTNTFRIFDTNVGWDQLTVLLVSLVGTGALYYFLRNRRMGIAMRGVVDNPSLLAITGENPVRVRRWAWIIGSVFASMAGLLLAPSLSLSALVITLLVVQAFGAAAIGYFANLPLTYVGGLAIGIVAAITTKYAATESWLTGFPVGLPFIVLFVVLIVTPKRRLAERRVVNALPVHRPWQAPLRARLLAVLAVLVVAAAAPAFSGVHQIVWSLALGDVILLLSLGLLVRESGQSSLAHLAFAAIGAAAFGHLDGSWHVPWLLAVLLAGVIAIPVGAILAVSAIRLSGVFLAIATLGFGILVEQMFYDTSIMFGQTTTGIPAPRPDVALGSWSLSSDTGFYYVLLIFAVVVTVLVFVIQRGRMGRLLRGLADSPTALETGGTNTNMTRLILFCISAALAAVAGALIASTYGFALGSNYSWFNSLTLFTLVIIAVGGAPWYAILAAIGYAIIPGYITSSEVNYYLQIIFGVFAIGYAIQGGNAVQVPPAVRRAIERASAWPGKRTRQPSTVEPGAAVASSAVASSAPVALAAVAGPLRRVALSSGLEVSGLTVRFGGLTAVRDVSLTAPLNRITGLVGPNGAGKTTTFNACSGLVRPTAGRVTLGERDVSRLGPAGRSRLGLGRTFQRSTLFDSLTVRENVAMGREAALAGVNPLTQLYTRPKDQRAIDQALDHAMELTGVARLADQQAGLLPTGQKRLVELARAIAGPFDLLLLDEPSSGLDADETERFGQILTALVSESGLGVLLVEHDMALVAQVCDHVYVLDFGEMIFEGSATAMLSSEAVKVAYLGTAGTSEAAIGSARAAGQ